MTKKVIFGKKNHRWKKGYTTILYIYVVGNMEAWVNLLYTSKKQIELLLSEFLDPW